MKIGTFFCCNILKGNKKSKKGKKNWSENKNNLTEQKKYNSYLVYITITYIFESSILSDFEIDLKIKKIKIAQRTND